MQWHRDMLRGFRDNAAYEGGRYLILAILAAVWPTISGILHVFWHKPWYWKLNGALIALTAVLFIIALWKLVRIGKSQRILYEGRKSMPFVEAPIMPIVAATDLSQPKKLKEKSARPTDDVENRKLAALKDRRTNLLAKIRRLEAKPESTESKYHDIAGAIQRTHRHLNEVNEAIKRSEKQSATLPRVTYEETGQIIDIFRDAPRVKVAITSLSAKAGEELEP
jgi:hypothetical protein